MIEPPKKLQRHCRMRFLRPSFGFWAVFFIVLISALSQPSWAAYGYSIWGNLKYQANFSHFDYVNPHAPKGGELRLASNLQSSAFDKYNPFTLRGSAPAYLAELVFESLLLAPLDETGTGYGLLAHSVELAKDGLSVTFRLRRNARFHNGDAVLAADVKHSFDMLTSVHSLPGYQAALAEVAGLDLLDERTVRYRFTNANRQLPLIVGSLPVFSRAWGRAIDPKTGQRKTFDQVIMDLPIGSGPYKIGPVQFGKDITYVRDPAYWARDLPLRRGTANFDRIVVKIYADNTARLQALKAAEFDWLRFYSAGDWARRLTGKRFESGELRKLELAHRQPSGFQSYVLNTRRAPLNDARVRQALGLAMDFEWMNRQLFYNAYQRVQGLFGQTECSASGPPSTGELALLEPWRAQLPAATFGPMLLPPRTDGAQSLRANLRRAQALLRQAGWAVQGGVLRNAQGQALVLEYLDSSNTAARVMAPWMRNLEKLGIHITLRTIDAALAQERLRRFDFDITSLAYAGTHYPGAEYASLFGSQAARTPGSDNFGGVSSPAIDALINRMSQAPSRPEFLAACRALDRVIAHGHYLIPQWTSTTYRMVYNTQRLARPAHMPPYALAENWVMDTWWAAQP